jgi:hypothetical protein
MGSAGERGGQVQLSSFELIEPAGLIKIACTYFY